MKLNRDFAKEGSRLPAHGKICEGRVDFEIEARMIYTPKHTVDDTFLKLSLDSVGGQCV